MEGVPVHGRFRCDIPRFSSLRSFDPFMTTSQNAVYAIFPEVVILAIAHSHAALLSGMLAARSQTLLTAIAFVGTKLVFRNGCRFQNHVARSLNGNVTRSLNRNVLAFDR